MSVITDPIVLATIGVLVVGILTLYFVYRHYWIAKKRALEGHADKSRNQLPPLTLPSSPLREYVIRVQVVGHSGVGKTHLLKQIDEEWNASPPASTSRADDAKAEHVRKLGNGIAKIVYKTIDVPGGKPGTWIDAIIKRKPQGLVVIVDHDMNDDETRTDKKRISSHIGMLRNLIGPLASSNLLNECKALLLIVNKYDLWGGHHTTRRSMTKKFQREFSELKGYFPHAFFVTGSVRTGHEVVRALTRFENAVLGVS